MKVALVHDYIKDYGGAEKVLLALHQMFPDAPVYTSVYIPEGLGPHKEKFKDIKIQTSFLQIIPFKERLISVFRVISPLAFRQFDLSSNDIIIVSQTGAYFPNAIRKTKNQKLITYTHTPPRYLYGYKTAREWQNNMLLKILGEITNHILRIVDFDASQNVDQFIANSEEVKARIKKFYRKDAIVVYPPAVEVQRHKSEVRSTQSNYYLTGGRLARSKGIDIIITAFNQLGWNLKIFGKGFAGFEDKLHALAKDNIEFVGEVDDTEKLELMSSAKAFIFASYDEDFGITPVEAMSVGTPVVAFNSGGVKETVVDGKTGMFFDENTPASLIKALKKFESMSFKNEECIKQTQKFSEEEFKKNIQKIVNNM